MSHERSTGFADNVAPKNHRELTALFLLANPRDGSLDTPVHTGGHHATKIPMLSPVAKLISSRIRNQVDRNHGERSNRCLPSTFSTRASISFTVPVFRSFPVPSPSLLPSHPVRICIYELYIRIPYPRFAILVSGNVKKKRLIPKVTHVAADVDSGRQRAP